jgi:hypothetical protein
MKYDISKNSAPMMSNLDMGTKCIKILLSGFKIQAQKLVPLFFSYTFIYDFDKQLSQCVPKTT